LRFKGSSGAFITSNPNKTTTLLGAYEQDVKHILKELNHPVQQGKLADVTFSGSKGGFNLANVSDDIYNEAQLLKAQNKGGLFDNVNAKWIDEAVKRGDDIIVVSDLKYMYTDGLLGRELTGFGKEIERLRVNHGHTYDPVTHRMVPLSDNF